MDYFNLTFFQKKYVFNDFFLCLKLLTKIKWNAIFLIGCELLLQPKAFLGNNLPISF